MVNRIELSGLIFNNILSFLHAGDGGKMCFLLN